ncbi:MAG: anaerobic ribonucleoside-triphosphate reductase activating protein [Proteobacteria bacterium]|nr:anaerobic ribonucleoside-triphosphate reductase activating protein [Pseudomonadota bacterium]MBU1687837.1 anaerobic ribonucleoside-triphosphate reductase activating protein [Pseudomonadota bacterium]
MIKGFLDTSMVDWPGKICAVIFLGGCNFRCPFCHNHQLVESPDSPLKSITETVIFTQLRPLQKWLGGICVSGGEPTLFHGLIPLLTRIKEAGFAVKLDTNGSRPAVLRDLLDHELIDMIAMDVKAPLEQKKYDRCCGTRVDLGAIQESIELILGADISHQFRMTVVPDFHSSRDIVEWVGAFPAGTQLKLQNYNPATVLDPERAGKKGFSPEAFTELELMITC